MNAIPAFDYTSADQLVSAAWRSNCLSGELFCGDGQGFDSRLLAERVATLLPKMTATKKTVFIDAFSKSWPKVGCLCHGQSDPINWSEVDSESLGDLFEGLYQIATSTRPAARSVDKLIVHGEKVAYSAEMEAMRLYPFQFGSPRIPGLIMSQIKALVLTHRHSPCTSNSLHWWPQSISQARCHAASSMAPICPRKAQGRSFPA